MSSPIAHHEFGPSTLKYIEVCPGYRSSDETNPMAEEGTMLHDRVERADLTDLSDEQKGLVQFCLDYAKPFMDGADFFKHEQRYEIRLYGDKDIQAS
jgi:hypothetical protein